MHIFCIEKYFKYFLNKSGRYFSFPKQIFSLIFLEFLRKRLPSAIIRQMNYKKCIEISPSIAMNITL